MLRLKIAVLALATLGTAAVAQSVTPGGLGSVGAVEGQVSIEGRALSSRSIGMEHLGAGHVLATANGKAEMILTPGAFLRVGSESTVKMVSPDAAHTEVSLMRGQAEVEVDQIDPDDRILVDLPQGQTQLMERGLYRFDAERSTVRVFDGKAAVYPGADLSTDVKPIEVKGGRELAVGAAGSTPQKFDRERAEDDLSRWSGMRSRYMNQEYDGGYYPGGSVTYGPGWYPGYYGYAPYWGPWGYPYGYGFYSPYAFYGGGFYGGYYGGWGRGFYGGGRFGGGPGHLGGGGGVHPGGGRR